MYTVFTSGINISELAAKIQAQHEAIRGLERGPNASVPAIVLPGLLWNRTDEPTYGEAIMRYNGTAFTVLMDADFTQINAGGTVVFTANQPMGSHILTGLAAGTAAGHSVRYEQVMLLSGVNAMTDHMNMGAKRITNLAEPTADDHAARRADTRPVAGSVSVGANATVNVELGFVPGIVIAQIGYAVSGTNVGSVGPMIFVSGVVNTAEVKATGVGYNNGSSVGGANMASLTRRNGTPVTGFTYTNPWSVTATLDYLAFKPSA